MKNIRVKLISVLLLLTLTIFVSGVSPISWLHATIDKFKANLEQELEVALGREVSIGEIKGLNIYQLELRNVTIAEKKKIKEGTALWIKKIVVNYNPAKLTILKENVLASISKITLFEPEIYICRKKDGSLNLSGMILDFLKNGSKTKTETTFAPKIFIKDGRGLYRDKLGFEEKPLGEPFELKLKEISGLVDFEKAPNIFFDISLKTDSKEENAETYLSGKANAQTGKFYLDVTAKYLNLAKWGNYLVDIPDLSIKSGGTNIKLKITGPAKEYGFIGASLAGNIYIYGGTGDFKNFKIKETAGNLKIEKKEIKIENLKATINEVPVKVSGSLLNLGKDAIDVNISSKVVPLNKLYLTLPALEKFDLDGTGETEIRVTGTISNPALASEATITKGGIFKQDISAEASLKYERGILNVDLKEVKALDGVLTGICVINFNEKIPTLEAYGSLKSADLSLFALETPQILGKAGATFEAKGDIKNFYILGSADFVGASIFGQSLDTGAVSIEVSEGTITLKDLSLRRKDAILRAHGSVEGDRFDLQTECKGFCLSGITPYILPQYIRTSIEASGTIESFTGNISFKLDQAFVKEPYKNILAQGRIKLINGKIERQAIDIAEGDIKLETGMLELKDFLVKFGTSQIMFSGKGGLGVPIDLKIAGKDVEVKDFKLLNLFLPEYLKDPKGVSDFDIEVSQELSKEAELAIPQSILDLNIKGKITLKNGQIGGEEITSAEASIEWEDKNLDFKYLFVKTPVSELISVGKIKSDGTLDVSISGKLDVTDLKALTAKYGKISGKVDLKTELKGNLNNPHISCDFLSNNFEWGEMHLDMSSGKFNYKDGILSFERPLMLYQKNDIYRLSGKIDLKETLKAKKGWQPEVDIELEALKGNLDTAFMLAEMLHKEFIARKAVIVGKERTLSRINMAGLRLPHVSSYKREKELLIYASDSTKILPPYFLIDFEGLLRESEKLTETAKIKSKDIGGKFTGTLKLKGKTDSLKGTLSLKAEKGFFENYDFDELSLLAQIERNTLDIKSLYFKKNKGKIEASGKVSTKKEIDLKVSAQKFPIDFLNFILKSNKPFEGTLNASIAISGETSSLSGFGSFEASQGNLANVLFEQASGEFAIKDNILNLKKFNIYDGKKREIVGASGKISLNRKKDISIIMNLKDRGIGILAIPLGGINFEESKGQASIALNGTWIKPNINGMFKISTFSFSIPRLRSNLENADAQIDINDNYINIQKLKAIWRGKATGGRRNMLDIKGTANLRQAFEKEGIIDLNLSLADAEHYIDIDKFYKGNLKFENINLAGPMQVMDSKKDEKEKHPLLSGKIILSKGKFYYSEPKENKTLPTVDLNVLLELAEDLYIVGGDVENIMAPDLTDVLLNLEAEGKDINIGGNLRQPSLTGRVKFKRGRVNILNRDFSLLSLDEQRLILKEDPDKIKENVAVFSGGKGREAELPELCLTSQVKVKGYIEEEEVLPGEPTIIRQEDVLVISRITGMPFISDTEKGIKIKLQSFIEDKTKKPPELIATDYTEEEMKILLLPDYIKTPLALKKGGLESITAKAVLVDYLNSRLQILLLHGVERELEKTLGLESLTLEYNFGKDLERLLPGGEETYTNEFHERRETIFGVGLAKGFFGRFFIDIRYSQSLEEKGEEAKSYSNYQITYKLTPIWSIIYYKEPLFPGLGYPYYQVTLKAGIRL